MNWESKWTSLLPLPFLQPAWFLMVGGDRSFKLALTEKDEEFSDELREDCEVRGMERSGREGEGSVRAGRGIPVSEVVSPPYTNSVCVGVEVSCKQS